MLRRVTVMAITLAVLAAELPAKETLSPEADLREDRWVLRTSP